MAEGTELMSDGLPLTMSPSSARTASHGQIGKLSAGQPGQCARPCYRLPCGGRRHEKGQLGRAHRIDRGHRPHSPLRHLCHHQGGLRSYTRTWIAELAQRGLRVNVVSPGPTDTVMMAANGRSARSPCRADPAGPHGAHGGSRGGSAVPQRRGKFHRGRCSMSTIGCVKFDLLRTSGVIAPTQPSVA